jgi:hypothetical protein
MDSQPIIAVDFDDTITTPGAVYPEIGPPQVGVREALQALHDLGCRVRLYSCRCNGKARDTGMLSVEQERIADYMRANNLWFDDIVLPEEGKPFANFYVDNKGVAYQGDWLVVLEVIRNGLGQRVADDRRIGYEVIADRLVASFFQKRSQ